MYKITQPLKECVMVAGVCIAGLSTPSASSIDYPINANNSPIPIEKSSTIFSPLEVDREIIESQWNDLWSIEATDTLNRFFTTMLEESRLPDPEAAAILEEHLWNLV